MPQRQNAATFIKSATEEEHQHTPQYESTKQLLDYLGILCPTRISKLPDPTINLEQCLLSGRIVLDSLPSTTSQLFEDPCIHTRMTASACLLHSTYRMRGSLRPAGPVLTVTQYIIPLSNQGKPPLIPNFLEPRTILSSDIRSHGLITRIS